MIVAVKAKVYSGTCVECSECGRKLTEYAYCVKEGNHNRDAFRKGLGTLIERLCERCLRKRRIEVIDE